MKVISKFFDNEKWSIFASLQTVIILACMKLGMNINSLKPLVLSSIIAFMSGNVFAKLIYTFFLCIVVWSNDKDFYKYTLVTLLGCFIASLVKEDNKIYILFYKNKLLKYLLLLLIVLWMIYIPYLLIKQTKILS